MKLYDRVSSNGVGELSVNGPKSIRVAPSIGFSGLDIANVSDVVATPPVDGATLADIDGPSVYLPHIDPGSGQIDAWIKSNLGNFQRLPSQ